LTCHLPYDREGATIRIGGMVRRSRSFQGGAYLPVDRLRPVGEPIPDLPPAAKLVVPLLQHDGEAAEPVVEVGQLIEAGQLIGKATGPTSMNVHAPAAGTVTAITRAATAARTDGPAVAIETSQDVTQTEDKADRLSSLAPTDAAQLAEIADHAGITDFRRPGSGLGDQLRLVITSGVGDIIINGLPHEPLVTAGRELLRQHVGTVLATAMRLRDALHAERLWIAVDKSDRNLINHCRQAAHGHAVRVAALANKYPQAAPVLLAWAVTGRQTPIGRQPEETGVLVLEVEPLLALAEAARTHRPMTHRVVNVVGPAVARPGLYRIPVGTSFTDVLRHAGLARSVARIIEGGPLTGVAVETPDAVVTKQTAAILVMNHEHERVPVPGPCIRCGWCQDACPVGLDPQMLLNAAERDDSALARSLQPGACLACGLCSYVCPAELPLSQAAIRWKEHAAHNV